MSIKNNQGCQLRAQASILQKVSTVSPEPFIAYLGGLFWYQELMYEYEKLSELTMEGLHSKIWKM